MAADIFDAQVNKASPGVDTVSEAWDTTRSLHLLKNNVKSETMGQRRGQLGLKGAYQVSVEVGLTI